MSIQALTQDSNEEQNYRWSGWKKVGQSDLKLWHVDDCEPVATLRGFVLASLAGQCLNHIQPIMTFSQS